MADGSVDRVLLIPSSKNCSSIGSKCFRLCSLLSGVGPASVEKLHLIPGATELEDLAICGELSWLKTLSSSRKLDSIGFGSAAWPPRSCLLWGLEGRERRPGVSCWCQCVCTEPTHQGSFSSHDLSVRPFVLLLRFLFKSDKGSFKGTRQVPFNEPFLHCTLGSISSWPGAHPVSRGEAVPGILLPLQSGTFCG